MTAPKQAAAALRPGLGSGMHWEEVKNLRVLCGRVFCALSPSGEEKMVQLHTCTRKMWEGERMSWQEEEGGEDAGLKSRFHMGGMKFILA